MDTQTISGLIGFLLDQDPALALLLVVLWVTARHLSSTQAKVDDLVRTMNPPSKDSKTALS